MTVTYKGMTKDFDYRVAEINFDEENETEIVGRAIFFMERVKGYKIDVVTDCYAVCEVEATKEEIREYAMYGLPNPDMQFLF